MEIQQSRVVKGRLALVPFRSPREEQSILSPPILRPQTTAKSSTNAFGTIIDASPETDSKESGSIVNIDRPSFRAALKKRAEKQRYFSEASQELLMMDQSNSSLQRNIRLIKRGIRDRIQSVDKTARAPRHRVNSPQHRSRIKSIDFVQHNKQTFYNIIPRSNRPISDTYWTRSMQLTPRKQRVIRGEESMWLEKVKFTPRANRLNVSKLKKPVMIQASFKYCGSCNAKGQPILIKPRTHKISVNK